MRTAVYLLFGFAFGFILNKSEVVSWYRILEMFRFESFYMYGIISSAVITGVVSVWGLKKFKVRDIYGNELDLTPKPKQLKAHFLGGTIFGLGWALTGACPGPVYTLIGASYFPMIVVLLFCLVGTFTYGIILKKLPH